MGGVQLKARGFWPADRRGVIRVWTPVLLVEAPHGAHFAVIVDPTAVGRVDAVIHPAPAADRGQSARGDTRRPAVRRALPRVVVLHPRRRCRGRPCRHGGIELAERDIVIVVAGFAAVVGDIDSAVRSEDQGAWSRAVDPHRPPVAECLLEDAVRWPVQPSQVCPVIRAGQRLAGDINGLGSFWSRRSMLNEYGALLSSASCRD